MMGKANKRVAFSAALVMGCVEVWHCFGGTMEIRFPGYDRDETLADFPALVALNEGVGGFSYGGFLSPLGYDLRFSNATETAELDYEIESWDTNGTSHVWVRIPEFTSNTMIRAYWGNLSATEQPVSCTKRRGVVLALQGRLASFAEPGRLDALREPRLPPRQRDP